MPLLQRNPDEAVLEPDEGDIHGGVLEKRSQLKPWYLVEIRSSSGGALGAADVAEHDGVIVVTPAGALPDPLPTPLTERLARLVVGGPVILDLSSVVLTSAAPVMGLARCALSASQRPGRCCVVCTSATARARLREWHLTRCLAVFGSVGDALQARRFVLEGYGTGWRPDPPDQHPIDRLRRLR